MEPDERLLKAIAYEEKLVVDGIKKVELVVEWGKKVESSPRKVP